MQISGTGATEYYIEDDVYTSILIITDTINSID